MNLLIAAAPVEKLQKIPADFWWKAALALAGFVAVIVILRKVAHMNKMVLGAIVFVVVVIMGFNWVYQRNEPAFLTPVIDKIAPFFPSKTTYNQ